MVLPLRRRDFNIGDIVVKSDYYSINNVPVFKYKIIRLGWFKAELERINYPALYGRRTKREMYHRLRKSDV